MMHPELRAAIGEDITDLADECLTCGELDGVEFECPESRRACGHHCNCSWVHDHCHWCDAEFGEVS